MQLKWSRVIVGLAASIGLLGGAEQASAAVWLDFFPTGVLCKGAAPPCPKQTTQYQQRWNARIIRPQGRWGCNGYTDVAGPYYWACTQSGSGRWIGLISVDNLAGSICANYSTVDYVASCGIEIN